MKNSVRLAALCCALLISTVALAVTAAALDAVGGAVLSTSAAKGVLHQCSRQTPQNVLGTWTPTKQDVRELEIRLPTALALEAQKHGTSYMPEMTFQRQYAGFLVGKRRIVYVNGFPRSAGDPARDGTTAARNFDWHREPVVVCDGGPAFFGVEYDPEKKTFAHFEFNGLL
jgi:hypothetical protein